ncbi:Vanadium-dependent haloperoxidase [Balamuthia mandrillaris]
MMAKPTMNKHLSLWLLLFTFSAVLPLSSSQPLADILYLQNNVPVLFSWINAIVPTLVTLEPPYLLRTTAYVTTAWFDSWAQYQSTALGSISGAAYRQPASERNDSNIEQALSYATYFVVLDLLPSTEPALTELMADLGFPLNGSVEEDTPRWVGTSVAEDIIDFMHRDGMNQLGDVLGSRHLQRSFQHHQRAYLDYTAYHPVNTFDRLNNPDRWQPLMTQDSLHVWFVQSHIVPHIRYAAGFGFSSADQELQGTTLSPVSFTEDEEQYRAQAEEVIDRVSSLTDRQKVLAEYFESKVMSLAFPFVHFAREDSFDLSEFIQGDFYLNQALWNAAILAWREKLRFDAVRPVSAIRFLHEDDDIEGWGGPGRGTVSLKGREWRSYLKTMQHSEFPSGSSCFCSAFVGALTRLFGEERAQNFNYTVAFPAGSSNVEPGVTPQEDIVHSWSTLEDYLEECGQSRVNGGVHFRPSVDAAFEICDQAADLAWGKYQSYLDGSGEVRDPEDRDVYDDDDHEEDGSGSSDDGEDGGESGSSSASALSSFFY